MKWGNHHTIELVLGFQPRDIDVVGVIAPRFQTWGSKPGAEKQRQSGKENEYDLSGMISPHRGTTLYQTIALLYPDRVPIDSEITGTTMLL